MNLLLTITYNSGEEVTYTAKAPEWAKWERETGNTISQAKEKLGIWDLMFLAWNANKRENAGKPIKPFEIWMDTVAEVVSKVGDANPKVIQQEA
jgi:hypothetical protein